MTQLLGRRLCRLLSAILHPDDGQIQLVELPLAGAGAERGLAHRLFHRIRPREGLDQIGGDLQ